jgi:hypothetical protein
LRRASPMAVSRLSSGPATLALTSAMPRRKSRQASADRPRPTPVVDRRPTATRRGHCAHQPERPAGSLDAPCLASASRNSRFMRLRPGIASNATPTGTNRIQGATERAGTQASRNRTTSRLTKRTKTRRLRRNRIVSVAPAAGGPPANAHSKTAVTLRRQWSPSTMRKPRTTMPSTSSRAFSNGDRELVGANCSKCWRQTHSKLEPLVRPSRRAQLHRAVVLRQALLAPLGQRHELSPTEHAVRSGRVPVGPRREVVTHRNRVPRGGRRQSLAAPGMTRSIRAASAWIEGRTPSAWPDCRSGGRERR